jgi:hypothetical protein
VRTTVRVLDRQSKGDVAVLQIFQAFGERFAVCAVCGHGYFRFGRAQYCSRPCSDRGRKAKFREKRRRENPRPRLRSILAKPPAVPEAAITARLRDVETYLLHPRVWGGGRGGAGCNNLQEATSAISEVLETLWRLLRTGREIKDLRAYAFMLLKRAAPKHWREFD